MTKQKEKESSPEIKENENYIRKRTPINFTMKDLDKEAEDDQGDDYKPPKSRKG